MAPEPGDLIATLSSVRRQSPLGLDQTVEYRAECEGYAVEHKAPAHALARLLAANGYDLRCYLRFVWDHGTPSLHGRLGEFARWTVVEGPKQDLAWRRWQPHPRAAAWEHELYVRLQDAPPETFRRDPTPGQKHAPPAGMEDAENGAGEVPATPLPANP